MVYLSKEGVSFLRDNTLFDRILIAHNFISMVSSQIDNFHVFDSLVQYQWERAYDIKMSPDVSIVEDLNWRSAYSIFSVPEFVLEVETFEDDRLRSEIADIYLKACVSEYWIVNLLDRRVEIYTFEANNYGEVVLCLNKIVTDENKNDLEMLSFPHVEVDFDKLFDLGIK